MMTIQEMREKTTQELQRECATLAQQLREHRFATSIQQERNVARRAALRRTIARIKTVLNERAQQAQ